jgi:ribosomal protein S18 acetylase RimI-like enzyme
VITLRHFGVADWQSTWAFLEPVFRAGDTYPYPVDITEDEARHAWIEVPSHTYVAVQDEAQVIGTYYIKPNQPGLGAHVCNCGYVVAPNARGRGVASRMCEHSQKEARRLGFRAMQYNLVVSTNERAVQLWKKQGFTVIGALPGAFHHQAKGYVDALVMYKTLEG